MSQPRRSARILVTKATQLKHALVAGPFCCPNPICQREFKTKNGLAKHCLVHSKACLQYCKSSLMAGKATTTTSTSDHEEEGSDTTQDNMQEDDSHGSNKSMDQDILEDWDAYTEISEAASIAWDIAGDGEESMQDDTNPNHTRHNGGGLGGYNQTILVEAQLLKILNDANTPHYLYHDIMNWAQNLQRMVTNLIILHAWIVKRLFCG